MVKQTLTRYAAIIASMALAGCTHVTRPTERSVVLCEATAELDPNAQVRGIWLKNPGYYDLESIGRPIGLRKLMQDCDGFVPFDSRSKFPSCFYIIRSTDEIFDEENRAKIKYPFDGRRSVRPDGSIVVDDLPDIKVPSGYFVWFDWVLI